MTGIKLQQCDGKQQCIQVFKQTRREAQRTAPEAIKSCIFLLEVSLSRNCMSTGLYKSPFASSLITTVSREVMVCFSQTYTMWLKALNTITYDDHNIS